MTHDLRIERLIDAPPGAVFDGFLDPDAQGELYGDETDPTWTVESELDLRSAGPGRSRSGPRARSPTARRMCSKRSIGRTGSPSDPVSPWWTTVTS
jgi:hypothetical protein